MGCSQEALESARNRELYLSPGFYCRVATKARGNQEDAKKNRLFAAAAPLGAQPAPGACWGALYPSLQRTKA
jgi:hypothetical protein